MRNEKYISFTPLLTKCSTSNMSSNMVVTSVKWSRVAAHWSGMEPQRLKQRIQFTCAVTSPLPQMDRTGQNKLHAFDWRGYSPICYAVLQEEQHYGNSWAFVYIKQSLKESEAGRKKATKCIQRSLAELRWQSVVQEPHRCAHQSPTTCSGIPNASAESPQGWRQAAGLCSCWREHPQGMRESHAAAQPETPNACVREHTDTMHSLNRRKAACVTCYSSNMKHIVTSKECSGKRNSHRQVGALKYM